MPPVSAIFEAEIGLQFTVGNARVLEPAAELFKRWWSALCLEDFNQCVQRKWRPVTGAAGGTS